MTFPKIVYIAANIGVPRIIPSTPNSPPAKITENKDQNPAKPTCEPTIFGPIRLPSICCKMNIIITNFKQAQGSIINNNKIYKKYIR